MGNSHVGVGVGVAGVLTTGVFSGYIAYLVGGEGLSEGFDYGLTLDTPGAVGLTSWTGVDVA